MAIEQEIKVPVGGLDETRRRLAGAGAVLEQLATFEENWVLDDAAGRLRATGRLLRVRRWGDAWTVTFKGPAAFAGGVKSRQELETGVGDGASVLALLAALGFTPVRRYQKRRESWRLGGVVVCLDETPLGCFVELEGDVEAVLAGSVTIGLDPADAARGSYLDLWLAHRELHPEAPEDMVFT